MNHLDLRHINLGDKNILTFETKKAASGVTLPHLAYVTKAANRFWSFWVIVRRSQNGEFGVMTKAGEFLAIEDRKWIGNKTYTNQ